MILPMMLIVEYNASLQELQLFGEILVTNLVRLGAHCLAGFVFVKCPLVKEITEMVMGIHTCIPVCLILNIP
jgi:hypothetical protein